MLQAQWPLVSATSNSQQNTKNVAHERIMSSTFYVSVKQEKQTVDFWGHISEMIKAKYGANDLQGHMDDCNVDIEGLFQARKQLDVYFATLKIKMYCSYVL